MNASWDKRKLTEKPYSLAKTGTLGRMCKIAEPTERRMRQWLKHDLLPRLTSYVTLRSSTAELLNTRYWCPSHIPLPLAATNQVRAMKKKRGTETHELMFRAFATAGLAQRLSARNSTPLMWVSFPFGLASFEHVPSLDSANHHWHTVFVERVQVTPFLSETVSRRCSGIFLCAQSMVGDAVILVEQYEKEGGGKRISLTHNKRSTTQNRLYENRLKQLVHCLQPSCSQICIHIDLLLPVHNLGISWTIVHKSTDCLLGQHSHAQIFHRSIHFCVISWD